MFTLVLAKLNLMGTVETRDSLKNNYLFDIFNDICSNYFSLIEPLDVDNYE
jgi:hypothetical protein